MSHDITRLIHLKNGNGIPCWHYVRISRTKMPLYMRMQQGEQIDVASLGEVLASGWGTTPPPHVQMKYGIDPYHLEDSLNHESDRNLHPETEKLEALAG